MSPRSTLFLCDSKMIDTMSPIGVKVMYSQKVSLTMNKYQSVDLANVHLQGQCPFLQR